MKTISNIQYPIFLFFVPFIVIQGMLCSLFFAAVPVSAANPLPEQNPMCWTEAACRAQFTANGWDFEAKNWEQGGPGEVCEDLGVCLPAGKTPLSIKIGTTGVESADLGEYIVLIYKYLVGIGGIVAAVLLVKGGFDWVISGGSPEAVKQAQATIGGALMGLLLLLGSYTLLYTINPDLVRLRLPGTYMVRNIPLGTTWCKDQPAGTMLALAQSSSEKKTKELKDLQNAFTIQANPSLNLSGVADINPAKQPVCGATYYPSSGTDTCQGHLCPLKDGKSHVCVNEDNKYQCAVGALSGTITGNGIKYPFVDGYLFLIAVCDRKVSETGIVAIPMRRGTVVDLQKNKEQQYIFRLDKAELGKEKEGMEKEKINCGFYLTADINDDSGVDDVYAIGRENGVCKKNLSVLAKGEEYKRRTRNILLVEEYTKVKDFLISVDELINGLVCDMPLSRSDFPAL